MRTLEELEREIEHLNTRIAHNEARLATKDLIKPRRLTITETLANDTRRVRFLREEIRRLNPTAAAS